MNKNDSARLFLVASKRQIADEEFKSIEFLELLKQLGGHPLSIVLMARQLTHGTTMSDLLKRLKTSKAKAILVRGISDGHGEHGESLIASLYSSFCNLDNCSKELFIALSMLPSGAQDFTLKHIFGEDSWESAQKLNDASLAEIRFGRITLLPPVRLFAESMLTDDIRKKYGPEIVRRMAINAQHFYNKFGEKEAKQFRFIFTLEEPNMRQAIELPSDLEIKTDSEIFYTHVGVLSYFLIELYNLSDRAKEGLELSEVVIPKLEKLGDKKNLGLVLYAFGAIKVRIYKFDEATEIFEKALKTLREIGEKDGEAATLKALGDVYMRTKDNQKAKEALETSLKICQEIKSKFGEARVLSALGDLYIQTREFEEAKAKFEAAIKIHKELESDRLAEANNLCGLAEVYRQTGALKEAQQILETANKIFEEIGDKVGIANTLRGLGDVYLKMKKLQEAKTSLELALEIYEEINVVHSFGQTLTSLGLVCLGLERMEEAKKRFAEALRIYRELGNMTGEEFVINVLKQISVSEKPASS